VALALALIWGGCAPYTLIEPKRIAIGDLYTLEPQVQWNAMESGKIVNWTVDGFPLEAVRFFRGLADGEPLFPELSRAGARPPTFSTRMAPSEVAEFVVDSLSLAGAQQVRMQNLRPRPFGTLEGFTFDMTYLHRNGLEAQGLVVGAVANGKLQLIIYTGTRQYYFPKYIADVDRMIDSIRIQ
jgi:hypothetical protein